MTKPNVILIMTDNQQAATLGCYGNSEIHTPNLDELASGGIRFDRAFCANAFCSPCRASTLTGMMPSQHGVHSWIDDRTSGDWPDGWHALAGLRTLPKEMQNLGYRTGLFGKYHLGETTTPGSGWNDFVTMEHGHVRSFYDNRIIDNGETYLQPGHAVDFFTDKALTFMAQQAAPFFAFLPFPAPYGHWPACNDGMRNRYSDRYDNCPMASVPRQGLSAEAIAHFRRVDKGSGGGLDYSMLLLAPNHLPGLRNYYAQISLIDEAVGRIAAAHPDALIIFTADHGLSLGHHGFWGHGAATWPSNLHLAAHSIPMIMHHPGAIPSATSDALMSNTDLFATILEIGGGEADSTLPSRSFAGHVKGAALPPSHVDEVFAEQEETRVLRTGDWAFFKRFRTDRSADLPDALYHVRNDPSETQNLANNPDYAAVTQELSNRIDAYFTRHARPEADLWRGGRPKQNSTVAHFWRDVWGPDWAPVYAYDQGHLTQV
ncbi:sulfatase [Sulfitobacter aestuariivivens]|uniref:Sulfatase-like hydrolase/transferase n=1 Tax=Sulfitobacter aestuariivivens TaxID=2766981 RepID=A0A927D7F9_9RHOB|nr:sulfatase-like hydrolase/transferase [Sulfitobacter aestuariivivens]MBD3665189.1 sulfatase-like hydrolase/transferase [Sulfitobacter aestuariivivens]